MDSGEKTTTVPILELDNGVEVDNRDRYRQVRSGEVATDGGRLDAQDRAEWRRKTRMADPHRRDLQPGR